MRFVYETRLGIYRAQVSLRSFTLGNDEKDIRERGLIMNLVEHALIHSDFAVQQRMLVTIGAEERNNCGWEDVKNHFKDFWPTDEQIEFRKGFVSYEAFERYVRLYQCNKEL
jgi:hypothetical protein